MPFSTAFAEDVHKLFFQAIGIPELADNDQTGPTATITMALHTADPGAGGDQTASEATYTGYTRITVARTTGGFQVTTNVLEFFNDVLFPEATGSAGGETLGFASFGTGTSDNLMYRGVITPAIVIPVGGGGVQPGLRGKDNAPSSKITLLDV